MSDDALPAPRRLPATLKDAIYKHGEADFPDETCGFIFGKDGELRLVPMENIQNRLHAEDPERNPRDAKTAYQFDPMEMLRVMDEQQEAGRLLWGIYHSHPDHDAYFSETDSAAAAPFGEPSYPGVVHLVASVRERRGVDLKAFDWSDADGAYVEVSLEIV